MNLKGKRIHIAGSADPGTDPAVLTYAHSLISNLTKRLAAMGALFLIDFGREPRSGTENTGPAIIFNWTIIEAVESALRQGLINPVSTQGPMLMGVLTSKADSQIPPDRRELYFHLRSQGAVGMEFIAPGWNSGAVRRERQSRLGDLLLAISGGEGVEHLAQQYSRKGKPVIPLDLSLGASFRDGTGGAVRLFDEALAGSTILFEVRGQAGPELLERTRTRQGETPVEEVVSSIVRLLGAITAPRAFYVRILNRALPEFQDVESFFRSVVDPVVKEFGFEPLEVGTGENNYAWINQAIFDGLHRSSVVVVDLTGSRPNCFIELGYALGNTQRVMVTARSDTTLPFDSSCIETYMWTPNTAADLLQKELKTYWTRNFNRPPLVSLK